jgi:hypothetical protein
MNVSFAGSECHVFFGVYVNGNIAIQLFDKETGEKVANATVCTDKLLDLRTVGIKDWSENAGMVEALIDGEIITSEKEYEEASGFVLIPFHKLTETAFEEMNRQIKEFLN